MATKQTKSKPAFVLISDLHAHAWSSFVKGSGRNNSRLRRSLQVLDASLKKAAELDVPWIFGGDIVHTAGYSLNVVMSELIETLAWYPDVLKLAVWGNHDARGVGSSRITIEETVWPALIKAVPKLYVLDPGSVTGSVDCGITFSGVGYQPSSSLLTYAKPSDVGIYHQTVRGTKAPNGFTLPEGIDPAELRKRHRLSVVGHVHHWQWIHGASPVGNGVFIPGSPEHHNFGDKGEHGWWIVDEDLVPEFVPGGSPEFRTVHTPAEVQNDGNFYRVEEVLAGQLLPEDVIAIAPSPTTIEGRDILRGARGEAAISAWLNAEPPDPPSTRYEEVGYELLGPHENSQLSDFKLARVLLRNFCSYESQEIKIQPGTFLVMGRGKDFPSNGAGKSTIFESIFWALFGRTTKGLSGDEVIRRGSDQCEVILEFQTEHDAWIQVRRSRGKKSQLEVELGSSEDTVGFIEGKSVNEVTEKLAKHLGITPELFQALGYFSQEKLLLFASATDGERKDMLGDLIGLSAYQAASTEAQSRAATLILEKERLTALREAATRRIDAEGKRLDTLKTQVEDWCGVQRVREEQLRGSIAKFDSNRAELRATLVAKEKEVALVSLREKLQRAREGKAKAIQELEGMAAGATSEQLIEVGRASTEATSAYRVLRSKLEAQASKHAELVKRYGAQKATLASGECPTCGQAIAAECLARCLDPLQDEMVLAQREWGDLHKQETGLREKAANLAAKWEEFSCGVEISKRRALHQAEIDQYTVLIATMEEQEVQVEFDADERVDQELNATRLNLEKQLTAIMAERNPYDAEFGGTLARQKEATQEAAELNAKREQVGFDIAVYGYWRRGFSKQGLQSLLVDDVANLFNKERGKIFPALTQGVYDVQFSTMSQTRAGEWREKTEFVIYEHGEPIPYGSLSGGQRRRIDVGVMLTLIKAVSKWMQVPGMLGLLVLDEVFGFLDSSGAEGLMEVLREVQEQIPSIFVVSHDQQLQALFPEVIVVEQDHEGVSKILSGVA